MEHKQRDGRYLSLGKTKHGNLSTKATNTLGADESVKSHMEFRKNISTQVVLPTITQLMMASDENTASGSVVTAINVLEFMAMRNLLGLWATKHIIIAQLFCRPDICES